MGHVEEFRFGAGNRAQLVFPREHVGTSYENGSEIDHLGFEVEDLQEWVRELEAKRVKILIRPYKIGGWNEAFIEDPNGIWIEFLQRS